MQPKRRGPSASEKKIRSRINSEIFRKKIKKAQKAELSTVDLRQMLKNMSSFLGVFACDQLKFIKSKFSIPKYLIVNLDPSNSPGSHWISLRIDRKSVEIFDSLGYNYRIWKILPLPLLIFLNSLRKTREIIFSPVLQSKSDTICGLFCVYFVLFRQINSFSQCISVFSSSLDLNKTIINKLLS